MTLCLIRYQYKKQSIKLCFFTEALFDKILKFIYNNIMKIVDILSGNHTVKLYTNGVSTPTKIILCMHGFNGDLWGDGFSKLRKKYDDILVCSFDSAGHGESEIKSLDITLDLVIDEITDVVNYLAKTYPDVPLYFYAISYGGYRAMVSIARNDYSNLKGIILVNPALKMLNVLEHLKDFSYKSLSPDAVVPMKASQNKYLSKKFLDDLYLNDVYKLQYKMQVPIKLIIGTNDDLIPRQDLIEFVQMTKCECIYLDDGHCIDTDASWEEIVKLIKEL